MITKYLHHSRYSCLLLYKKIAVNKMLSPTHIDIPIFET